MGLRFRIEKRSLTMSYNPEILVAPKDLAEIELLAAAGVDAFVVGDARFALCVRGSFSSTDLEQAVNLVHELGKKVYLLIDAIFPNALLDELSTFLQEIIHIPFDGVRVADLGAMMLIREKLPQMPIHFVDAMMLTNHFTVNYWAHRGVSRVRLAHELTLDEVLAIKQAAQCELELLIQGAPLMFTSRRKLVENYLDFQRHFGKNITIKTDGNFLHDSERKLDYPLVENEHGTHIFGGNDVCMIDDLTAIAAANVDVLYVESFTYSKTADLVEVIKLYKMAIQLLTVEPEKYAQAGMVLYAEVAKRQGENRQTDRGFYYKPTIYKNKSGSER
jgi:putative protease